MRKEGIVKIKDEITVWLFMTGSTVEMPPILTLSSCNVIVLFIAGNTVPLIARYVFS